jgi:hypothetical protein
MYADVCVSDFQAGHLLPQVDVGHSGSIGHILVRHFGIFDIQNGKAQIPRVLIEVIERDCKRLARRWWCEKSVLLKKIELGWQIQGRGSEQLAIFQDLVKQTAKSNASAKSGSATLISWKVNRLKSCLSRMIKGGVHG